jgi:hypothetical protein
MHDREDERRSVEQPVHDHPGIDAVHAAAEKGETDSERDEEW